MAVKGVIYYILSSSLLLLYTTKKKHIRDLEISGCIGGEAVNGGAVLGGDYVKIRLCKLNKQLLPCLHSIHNSLTLS